MFYYRRILNNNSVNTNAERKSRQLKQYIYLKHIDKYTDLFGLPLDNYGIVKNLQDSYNNAVNSTSYRLGHFLLSPFFAIRKLLSK